MSHGEGAGERQTAPVETAARARIPACPTAAASEPGRQHQPDRRPAGRRSRRSGRAVGTRPSSTNPVRNVPVIAPTVPIADNRPTIEPLVATSVSVARTIIGPTADRIAAGATKAAVARRHDRDEPVAQAVHRDRPERPDDRDRGDRREATEHERRPQQRQRPDTRPPHGRRATPRARCRPGSRR